MNAFLLKNMIRVSNKKGQGMIEWALIVVLIAVAVIGLLTLVGGGLGENLQKIINALTGK